MPIAPTLGWDTVFAVHIDDLNEAIEKRHASPQDFAIEDPEDNIDARGRFGTWRIAPGGGDGLIWMSLPFQDTIVRREAGTSPPMSGVVTIQVRLRFLERDAPSRPGGGRPLELRVQAAPDPSDEKPVSIIGHVVYEGERPKFSVDTALRTLLEMWLNANLHAFEHVFAVAEVNAGATPGFEWLQPSHVDYAYQLLGPKDGCLAVLCMTEGRHPPASAQVPYSAIPDGARAGFLISKARLLEKLVLPMMPMLFPGSRPEDYALSREGDAIVATHRDIFFHVRGDDGKIHTAQLMNFELSMEANEIAFSMITQTEVSPGIHAWCRTENFLGVKTTKWQGKKTIEFYDTQPQIVNHWVENDPGFEIAEIILGVIAGIALLIAMFATAGTALAVGALVVGLLAGAAAGGILATKAVIDKIGTDQAPSVDALVMNCTQPIQWTGGKGFEMIYARLNDSLQLAGALTG